MLRKQPRKKCYIAEICKNLEIISFTKQLFQNNIQNKLNSEIKIKQKKIKNKINISNTKQFKKVKAKTEIKLMKN
jgi:hypothetical protein